MAQMLHFYVGVRGEIMRYLSILISLFLFGYRVAVADGGQAQKRLEAPPANLKEDITQLSEATLWTRAAQEIKSDLSRMFEMIDEKDPQKVEEYASLAEERFRPYLNEIERRIKNDLIKAPPLKGTEHMTAKEFDRRDKLEKDLETLADKIKDQMDVVKEKRRLLDNYKGDVRALLEPYRKAKEELEALLEEQSGIETAIQDIVDGAVKRGQANWEKANRVALENQAKEMRAHLEGGRVRESEPTMVGWKGLVEKKRASHE